ncbi:MAG: hypothetical protein M3041_07150 [Acidobacteriota bacterium]|nr:hypothetical protein [Acidobacteriota bacterium]
MVTNLGPFTATAVTQIDTIPANMAIPTLSSMILGFLPAVLAAVALVKLK